MSDTIKGADERALDALVQLVAALNWRAAVSVGRNLDKLDFADQKVWDAIDKANEVIALPRASLGAAQVPSEWQPIESVAGSPDEILLLKTTGRQAIETGWYARNLLEAAKKEGDTCVYVSWMHLPTALSQQKDAPTVGAAQAPSLSKVSQWDVSAVMNQLSASPSCVAAFRRILAALSQQGDAS